MKIWRKTTLKDTRKKKTPDKQTQGKERERQRNAENGQQPLCGKTFYRDLVCMPYGDNMYQYGAGMQEYGESMHQFGAGM